MSQSYSTVLSPDKDTAIRVKILLEKEFGNINGFHVIIVPWEPGYSLKIYKDCLTFAEFLNLCDLCECEGCHVIS